MVDCGPFGTLMKVLDSSQKNAHTHVLYTFSGDSQSLGIYMDFTVLKTSMPYKIWSYLALLIHVTQHTKYHQLHSRSSALPPFILLGIVDTVL